MPTAQMEKEARVRRIDNDFKYHSTQPDQIDKYAAIRETAKVLAYLINDVCPESREKNLAMTNLEQSVMWSNAAIARN